MKRLLCFLLILSALLCGCQTRNAPAETTPPTTVPTEALPPETTEAVWTGFTGTLEGYVFCHEAERDKNWEEDILTIAEAYLEDHPWLVDDTTMTYEVESYISTPNWEWKSQYIPEKREAFLAGINDLILRIPEHPDESLPWELQRVLAGIGECHSSLQINAEETFFLYFYPFCEEDRLAIRAVTVPEDKPHLLYAELTAINGVSVEEILERIRPYSSADADSGFMNDAVLYTMAQPTLLRTVSIMEPEDTSAEFTFLTESGETVTETRDAKQYDEYAGEPMLDHFYQFQLPYAFYDWTEKDYWIDHWEELSTLYIRLSQYDAGQEEAYLETNKEIYAVLNSVNTMDKIILDLRQNGGGSPSSRVLSGLMNFLRNPKVGQVYVLIDGGTFSMSVIASYNIRTEIPDAIFVGTPTGQGLPTGSVRDELITPHNKLRTRTPGGMSVLESGDSFLCFEPDVLVYQTLKDYKNGVDTVLQYVIDRN